MNAFVGIRFLLALLVLLAGTQSFTIRSSQTESFCNPNGTLIQRSSTQCECKEAVIGALCNECKLGYFNLNENGCSKCFCFAGHHQLIDERHRLTAELRLSDGLVSCEAVELELNRIEIDFGTEINTSWPLIEFSKHPNKLADQNEHNELDKDGGLDSDLDSDLNGDRPGSSNAAEIRLESTRRKGYLEITSEDEQFNDRTFYWTLDRRFLGNRLNSYGHKFSFKLLYSILRGDVTENTFKYFKHWPDLILASRIANRSIAIGYKGLDYEEQLESDSPVRIEMTLNERNWFQLDPVNWQLTERPIDAALFRLALMRVEHFLLRAKYHTDQIESRLYRVQLEQQGSSLEQQSSLPAEGSQVQLSNQPIGRRVVSENCASSCPRPFAGPHCERCESGHYMVVHFRNKMAAKFKRDFLLECKACDCNGQPCDQRGKCLCASSTQGERCERCGVGYFGDPLQGIQCKQCAGQSSLFCTPCTDGYHLPAGLDYNLAASNGNLSDNSTADSTDLTTNKVSSSAEPRTSNQLKAYQEKCVPCACSERGSFNDTCDQFTGQCHCRANHSGPKCTQCEPGFKLTLGGCLAENCWQNEAKPHSVCIARLIESMNEFDFEHKFQLADLSEVRIRPQTTLSALAARHRDLNNTYSQFWSNNFVQSLADSNAVFESLNKEWKLNEREYDALMNQLNVDGEISEFLLNGSEQTFERLIAFRDEITRQMDKLIALKYQRLFDREEIQKFANNEAALLKRTKKELSEEYYSKRMKESKKSEADWNRLHANISGLAKQIMLNREEIVGLFDRLFGFESELAERRHYIENELETKIDLVFELVKHLNHLLTTVERLQRDAGDENVQIEQKIVDAHYINNVTASIASKLALGFFDFETRLARFVQLLNDDLRERFLRLNAANEEKYVHICNVHLLDLRQELAILEKSLNNSGLLNEDLLADFALNRINLVDQVQLGSNQIENLDFNLDNFDLEDELAQLNLPSDFKQTNEQLENKASHLVRVTSEINENLNDIADQLKTKKRQIETLNNKTFIIDEMDGNVKIRNDLLMEIEQGLNNLTRKIYLNRYTDNAYLISPAIEIKIFEHDLTLSRLSKELLPDYVRRLTALKQEPDPEAVNASVDEHLYHINNSIQIKKKCVDSFDLRNKKIELLNEQTKELKIKVDNQVRHAKQLLANLKLGLAMKQEKSGKCERTINLENLEPASHLKIEFLYSFAGDSTDLYLEKETNRHTILLVGSIDKQFVWFELEGGQIKVSWNFGSSSDQLKSPLKLRENDEHFKQKDAYYQIQFVRIAQQSSLIVGDAFDSKSATVLKYTGDLIMKLDKRLYLGSYLAHRSLDRSDVSSDDRQSMNESTHEWPERFTAAIADLSINDEPIGLWNFESTNDFCVPLKAIPLNERTDEVHTFSGQNSYLKLGQINRYDGRRYTIRMDFRSFSNDGLLVASFNEASGDLIALEMRDGHLRLTVLTERLQMELKTKNKYNNGAWQTVIAEREDHLAMITTDEEQLEGYLKSKKLVSSKDNLEDFLNRQPDVSNSSSGGLSDQPKIVELDLRRSAIFVGGLPIDQRTASLAFEPFYGCIRQIQIETTPINLNNQNSFGVHGSAAPSPNLIKQMSFKSTNSFIKFNNLALQNWTNFGFSFKTSLSNCSILAFAEIAPDQTPKRALSFDLLNNKLLFTLAVDGDFNSTLLNNYELNDANYHTIFLVNHRSSIQILIDHERQTETLESVHIENPAKLLERLTVLELGRRQSTMQIDELNLENLFFIGNLKEFVLNNKLINLDSHFVQASDVGFVA